MSKKTKKKQNKPNQGNDNLKAIILKKNDLVGGRVKGYPLWPGYIEKVEFINNRPKYTIRFFGSNDTSRNCVEIKHFKDFTAREKSCLRKGFKEAYDACQEKYDLLVGTDPQEDQEKDEVQEEVKIKEEKKEDEKEEQKDGLRNLHAKKTVVKEEIKSKVEEDEENSTLLQKETKTLVTESLSSVPDSVKHPSHLDSEKKNHTGKRKASQAEKKSHEPLLKRMKRDVKNQDLQTCANETGKTGAAAAKHSGLRASPKKRSDSLNLSKSKSPKYEGENVMVESKERTIAKLLDKVNKKIKEKEDRKVKLKEIKRAKKASEKLEPTIRNLNQFSKDLNKYSAVKNDDTLGEDWDRLFQKYKTVLRVLDKCFEYDYFTDNQRKMSNQSEYRKCHEILEMIVKNLKEAQKDPNLPSNLKKNFKACLKLMKDHKCIKRFKNEFPKEQKNAMIERNDNETASIETH